LLRPLTRSALIRPPTPFLRMMPPMKPLTHLLLSLCLLLAIGSLTCLAEPTTAPALTWTSLRTNEQFHIPLSLDLLATFVFAFTGAIGAVQRGYDYVGVVIVALLSGVGGSLLRDGVFLQHGPPLAISDSRYMFIILGACVAGTLVSRLRRGIHMLLLIVDAFGLGAYAMVGTQASLNAGIPVMGAALVGMLNGVGGSVLRDIVIREEPLVFKPSEHYAGAALAGIVVFLILNALGFSRLLAGSAGIVTTLSLRMLSVWFGWKTRPLGALNWMERPAATEVGHQTGVE
jgi:uncharacterized membrane protein YeiH